MENMNEATLPELPQPQLNESDADYGFRCAEAVGAYQLFTMVRDHIVAKADELQMLTAGRELTPQEKCTANDLRNQLIQQQSALDAAWQFETIVETGTRKVN